MRTATPHVVELNRRGGTEFFVEWRENGKRHREKAHPGLCKCRKKTCEHRNAARIRAAELTAAPEAMQPGKSRSIPQAITEYLATSEHRISPGTASLYRITLNQFEGYCREAGIRGTADLTPQHVVAFRHSSAAGKFHNPLRNVRKGETSRAPQPRAATTVNICLRNLRAFCSFCVSIGYMEANPVQSARKAVFVASKGRENILTPEEHAKCLTGLKGKYRALYVVLYATGMRLGELCNLRCEDIDLKKQVLHIRCREDWKPKHGIERTIPLNAKVAPQALQVLRGLIKGRTGYLWGKPLNVQMTSKRLSRHFSRLGIKGAFPERGKVTPHTLRHTYASRLLNQHGMPPTLAQSCTGHKTLSVLMKYCHTQTRDVQSFIARM